MYVVRAKKSMETNAEKFETEIDQQNLMKTKLEYSEIETVQFFSHFSSLAHTQKRFTRISLSINLIMCDTHSCWNFTFLVLFLGKKSVEFSRSVQKRNERKCTTNKNGANVWNSRLKMCFFSGSFIIVFERTTTVCTTGQVTICLYGACDQLKSFSALIHLKWNWNSTAVHLLPRVSRPPHMTWIFQSLQFYSALFFFVLFAL